MIKVTINNEMLRLIEEIDENRFSAASVTLSPVVTNRLRKNSRKKSSYASNRIEGNPLTEEQAAAAIDKDEKKHLLKPEQEVRNYYLALEYLEEQRKKDAPFTKKMILDVQRYVEKGASKEKTGLRGPMPPDVLFAVYDAESGKAEYIPPEYKDIPALLDELIGYVNTTDDHPLIVAAVVHYQMVTIHPFEDGNGRTARLLSGYILDRGGYGFNGLGSLEEYFAYDTEAYYSAMQMELPALYYLGRNDPPHPEIWILYFLRMMALYSKKVCELTGSSGEEEISGSLSYLREKEKALLLYLVKNNKREFTPIETSRALGVTNHTVINRTAMLIKNGFVIPLLANERIRAYRLSDMTLGHREELIRLLGK